MWCINSLGADEPWGSREEDSACDVGGPGTSCDRKKRTGQRATDALSRSDPNNKEEVTGSSVGMYLKDRQARVEKEKEEARWTSPKCRVG
jgi:hypothetical protein